MTCACGEDHEHVFGKWTPAKRAEAMSPAVAVRDRLAWLLKGRHRWPVGNVIRCEIVVNARAAIRMLKGCQ